LLLLVYFYMIWWWLDTLFGYHLRGRHI
jgi:hypothetical protein